MGRRLLFLVVEDPGGEYTIDVTDCGDAELLAKVEALRGRARSVGTVQFGDVNVDFELGCARKDGEPVALTAREFELLRYLVEHREEVVSRQQILRGVWQYQPGVSTRTIDTHIAWLRQKLEDSPQNPRHIRTIRGVGYRFSG